MRIPETIKAIIFDYDGVLGDSTSFNKYACMEAAKLCGIELEPDVYVNCAPGGATIQEIGKCIVAHYGKPNLVGDFINYKKSFDGEYAQKVELYNGVVDVVHRLSRSFMLAVNTGTRHILVDSVLAKYQINDSFIHVVAAEDIKRGKPDPESYLLTCKKLGITPELALVVEDGISGIKAALAAGCYVVGITTSLNKEELRKIGCRSVIENLTELMAPNEA